MSVVCIVIMAPALFTGFFLAMGILARRDRKELEALEKQVEALGIIAAGFNAPETAAREKNGSVLRQEDLP